MKPASPYFLFFLVATVLFSTLSASAALTASEKAEELFLKGQYDKAITAADKAIDSDSGKRYELYYLKGLSQLKLGRFADSRKTFEYILEKYPRSSRALDSYIGIGDAYLLEGNRTGALRTYKKAAEEFNDNKNAAIARQRIADCGEKPAPKEEYRQPAPVKHDTAYKESVNFVPKDKPPIQADALPADTDKTVKSGYFSVQVGSFKSRSNAQKLASKLSVKGYEARAEMPPASDRLYRVKVGRLHSNEEAERLAAKLKREGYPTRICRED